MLMMCFEEKEVVGLGTDFVGGWNVTKLPTWWYFFSHQRC
jgi:hypothetical protein